MNYFISERFTYKLSYYSVCYCLPTFDADLDVQNNCSQMSESYMLGDVECVWNCCPLGVDFLTETFVLQCKKLHFTTLANQPLDY